MSGAGRVTPGEERTCPHCRATILRSATVCPSCGHNLRYNSPGTHRGEEIARQMVGVGALHPDESRTFTVAVTVSKQAGPEPAKTR